MMGLQGNGKVSDLKDRYLSFCSVSCYNNIFFPCLTPPLYFEKMTEIKKESGNCGPQKIKESVKEMIRI